MLIQFGDVEDDVLIIEPYIGLLIEAAGRTADKTVDDIGKALCFR